MIWFYPTVVSKPRENRLCVRNKFILVLSDSAFNRSKDCHGVLSKQERHTQLCRLSLHNSKVHCSHSGPFRLEWFSRRWQSISLTIGVAFSNSHKHAIWAKREGCNYTSGLCTSSYHWPELLKSVIFTDNYLQFSWLSGFCSASIWSMVWLPHRFTEDFSQ